VVVSRVEFEWDEGKNRANQKKHGISFEDAIRVFSDPLCISAPERVVEGVLLLMVAHTVLEERGEDELIEVIRIITARRATANERRRYEDENC